MSDLLNELADSIADAHDGDYDDGLDMHMAAHHSGGSSQERMIDFELENDNGVWKFQAILREVREDAEEDE